MSLQQLGKEREKEVTTPAARNYALSPERGEKDRPTCRSQNALLWVLSKESRQGRRRDPVELDWKEEEGFQARPRRLLPRFCLRRIYLSFPIESTTLKKLRKNNRKDLGTLPGDSFRTGEKKVSSAARSVYSSLL